MSAVMSGLVPCDSCSRHVKAGDARCPFCGASLGASAAKPGPPRAPMGASRAALFAASAGTLLATAACSTSTPTDRDAEAPDAISVDAPVGDGAVDAPGAQPAYGGSIVPDATIGSAEDAGGDAPSVVALYGAVPTDV
jgi:hypothetical protein